MGFKLFEGNFTAIIWSNRTSKRGERHKLNRNHHNDSLSYSLPVSYLGKSQRVTSRSGS